MSIGLLGALAIALAIVAGVALKVLALWRSNRAAIDKIARMRAQIEEYEKARQVEQQRAAPRPVETSTKETSTKKVVKDEGPKAERTARKRVFGKLATMASIVSVESGQATYLVATADEGLGRPLFVERRCAAMMTLRTVMTVLRDLGHDEDSLGGTFLDVGASIGTSTIPALVEHGFARAVACEPDPENFRLLRLNLVANQLEERVRAFQVAISDARGSIDLALSDSNWGDHRVVTEHTVAPLNGRRRIEIERTTIDDLIGGDGIGADDIGLVWIDAQGHEGQILMGASSLLERRPPIVFEFWAPELARNGGLPVVQEIVEAQDGYLVDLRTASEDGFEARPPSSIRGMAAQYLDSGETTDLLLVAK
jgi:FkbM family methyltransferase